MTRPDDSTLSPDDLKAIQKQARKLMDKADAWDIYPVPLEQILDAANVRVAHRSAFDLAEFLEFARDKAIEVGSKVKKAISKTFGLYDAGDALIHIDESVKPSKQTFLTLHETGHHSIPTHRKMFRLFQDCEQTLHPDIADQFEREANNFARYVLFKGTAYMEQAADHPFGIKTPIKLAKTFGSSLYASAREFARTNAKACVVFVLEPVEFCDGIGPLAQVRRVEPSPEFLMRFGRPTDRAVDENHVLWPVVPIDRKMSRPTPMQLTDRNGAVHDCLAEAFDTTHNILILLYPVSELRPQISVS